MWWGKGEAEEAAPISGKQADLQSARAAVIVGSTVETCGSLSTVTIEIVCTGMALGNLWNRRGFRPP